MRHIIAIGLLVFLIPSAIFAHKDDYLNETFVYRTVDRGELELEYWFDYHQLIPSQAGHYQHTFSVEYGLTDSWMVDFALNYGDLGLARDNELSRWRVETRRRLGEEGQRTPDVAFSLELEGEKDKSEWEEQITPRIVLSHDFGAKFNTTLNLQCSFGVAADVTAIPGYNLGLRYPADGMLRVGAEIIQTFDHRVGSLLIPQIWILPWPEGVFKFGYAKAYGSEERYYLRVAFEAGI